MGNKGTKKSLSQGLSPKQIVMLKANTHYSEQEIQEWHNKFVRDYPNGKINKNQFVDMYKQFVKHNHAENFCKLAFSAFDTNHDGTIDFDEFLLCVAATSQSDLDHRLEVVFDICDSSHDGQINRKELANMISVMYDLLGETNRHGDHDPKKQASEIIADLDVNGDKKLNKYEFISGCKNHPNICRMLVPLN